MTSMPTSGKWLWVTLSLLVTICQKWQPGIVRRLFSPHSYQVQLDDGRVWSSRRHVDDASQNSPSLKPVESVCRSKLFHAMSPNANTPPQDELDTKDTPLTSPRPVLRRSLCISTPPQRLIEHI